jgi:hypothetical protein
VAIQDAEARIADLLHRMQSPSDPDPALPAREAARQRARADALAERLRSAEEEIERLRTPGDRPLMGEAAEAAAASGAS